MCFRGENEIEKIQYLLIGMFILQCLLVSLPWSQWLRAPCPALSRRSISAHLTAQLPRRGYRHIALLQIRGARAHRWRHPEAG